MLIICVLALLWLSEFGCERIGTPWKHIVIYTCIPIRGVHIGCREQWQGVIHIPCGEDAETNPGV